MRAGLVLWFIFLASDNVVMFLASVVLWLRKRDSQIGLLLSLALGAITLENCVATFSPFLLAPVTRGNLFADITPSYIAVRAVARVLRATAVWALVLTIIGAFSGRRDPS